MIVIGTNGNGGGDNDTVIGVDGNGGGDDDSVIGVNGKVTGGGSSPSGGGHSSNSALGTYTWVWGFEKCWPVQAMHQ